MKLAAYCRVSTDKADQLNSLDAQMRFFREYAVKNGHELVEIYADEGISGTSTRNRKEFLRLMEDARRGGFDMVVAKDISRFARNTVDLLTNLRTLKARGIDTYFLTSNQTALGNSEFVLTMYGALAQEESANISKRVKFGKRLNAEKGRVPNLVFGYDKREGDYFHLTVNEAEAEAVRRMFSWYAEEDWGALKIARALNARGVSTKRGCEWTQNAVSRILRNPLYAGRLVNGRQEVADFLTGRRAEREESEWLVQERPELRVVSQELFDRVQAAMENRRAQFCNGGKRQSSRHPFSTLIQCECCGWSFRRLERQTSRGPVAKWVCSGRNANGTGSCPNRTALPEELLLREVRDYWEAALSRRPNAIAMLERERERLRAAGALAKGSEQASAVRRQKLARSRKKFLELYENDLISLEELREKTAAIRAELERLGLTSEGPETNAPPPPERFQSVGEALARVTLSHRVLRRIVDRVETDGQGRVTVRLRSFFRGESVPVCTPHT